MEKRAVLKNYGLLGAMLAAMLTGGVTGWLWPAAAGTVRPLGQIFINLMFCVVVPLVFSSIAGAIAGMRSVRRAGRIMGVTVLTFVVTGILAAVLMFLLMKAFPPVLTPWQSLPTEAVGDYAAPGQLLVNFFTAEDFVGLLSRRAMLPLIVFSVLLGFAANLAGGPDGPVARGLTAVTQVMMQLIRLLTYYAPVAFFAIFAGLVADYGPKIAGAYGRAMAVYYPLCFVYLFTVFPLMARLGLTCALLTGSTRSKERRETLAGLAGGTIDLCIGTHALLTGDVQYGRLGLVVTDEQHRFGVNQRAALSQKAEAPHMLVLSATPIPRTLALVIYGDLDVSVIDQLPPGRQKVDTFALGESYRPRVNAFLRKQVQEGHQVFIVCPLVGDGDTLPDERKAVTAYAKKLQEETFPDLRVSVLHGKMKPKEKEKVMETFAAGESDILVSTTVVEVGVDVPNATCMVVENAERFGLSQLHQLRGRVGRGQAKSYCILLSEHPSEETRRRLKVMTRTNNGFEISQEDLHLRGPGDFFGQRQHGLPTLKIADLACDMQLLEEAQSAARALLCRDEDLSRPEHRPLLERVRELFHDTADSMN